METARTALSYTRSAPNLQWIHSEDCRSQWLKRSWWTSQSIQNSTTFKVRKCSPYSSTPSAVAQYHVLPCSAMPAAAAAQISYRKFYQILLYLNMINLESRTREWIESRHKQYSYIKDASLLEITIRAFSLLESLVRSGCPFIFKGLCVVHINLSRQSL